MASRRTQRPRVRGRAPPAALDAGAPLRKQSIATHIVERVLEMLLNRQLGVGSFIGTEATISEQFGVSRFPVREALSRLEALGIIEIKRGSGGGISVAQGNPDHFAELLAVHFSLADITLEELFEARLAIVPKATEHAARHATEDDVAALTEHLNRFVALRHEFDAALQALLDFHLKLVELSRLRTLTALNRSLCYLLRDLHRQYPPPLLTTSREVNAYGLRNLRSVVERIAARDGEGAGEVMRRAIIEHRRAVLALASQT